jgi:hypothetical protein
MIFDLRLFSCHPRLPKFAPNGPICTSLAKFTIIKVNEQPSVQTIITPRPPRQQSLPVAPRFEKAATVLWQCHHRHELPSRRSLKLQARPKDMVRTPNIGHLDAHAAKSSYVVEVCCLSFSVWGSAVRDKKGRSTDQERYTLRGCSPLARCGEPSRHTSPAELILPC